MLVFLYLINNVIKRLQNKKHILNISPVIIKGFSMINGLFIQFGLIRYKAFKFNNIR